MAIAVACVAPASSNTSVAKRVKAIVLGTDGSAAVASNKIGGHLHGRCPFGASLKELIR
jgi:hypothetical protein